MFLKYYIILFALLISLSPRVHSQNQGFTAGAVVGFYGVHINGDISEVYSQANGELWGTGGFSLGFNVKKSFNKSIYGAFELRYSCKGSIFEFVTTYGTIAYEQIRLDYIELPLLVGFKLNLKKKYLFFETGFAYSYLINSQMTVNDLSWWDTSSIENNFKKNELSILANLKYPIIKSEKLLLGLRFSHSLFSIHNNYKLYNLNYGIEIYYFFNKKVK